MQYPLYVKNCIDRLISAGFNAYAVGGAVRDSLLGLTPNDFDVTTSATPDKVLSVFSDMRTVPTGLKHGTVTLLCEQGGEVLPIEITTFRVDGDYLDSRHPTSVCFSSSLPDDLSRRDFTVNAIAFNEYEGFVDVFGGILDLNAGLIRAVGEPSKRFSEDALRILRAFRFSAQLGFDIEGSTYLAACNCAPMLKNIARERICTELKRLICSKNALQALQMMFDGGVTACIFDGASLANDHLLKKISCVPEDFFELRLALLLSSLENIDTRASLDSLRLSNAEKKTVLRLLDIKNGDKAHSIFDCPDASASARRFLHFYSDIYDSALCALKIFYENENISAIVGAIECERMMRNALSLSDLAVSGRDILELCPQDPSLIGKTLEFLLFQVIDTPSLNEKGALMAVASDYINSKEN